MLTAGSLGAGLGLGILLLVYGVHPPRLSLAATLSALHPANPPTSQVPVAARQDEGWAIRWAAAGVPLLTRLGLPRARTQADLVVCERDPARHLAEQFALAAAGLMLPPVVAAALGLAGVHIGLVVPAWASVLLAAGGFLLPEHQVRTLARQRRQDLRAALSGVLDLVVVGLAGGAGVEQALRDATTDPTNWGQHRLRQAVNAAHLARVPPWQTLGQLGTDTGVPALCELAAALQLSGTEGARVRATLTARAVSLRDHELSDAEAAAQSATERMSLPVVALFAAFLVFIGFPAVHAVLNAL